MMERVTIRLPTQQVAMLEKLVEAGEFPTVSEAVRYSVRELIGKHANRVIRDSEQISFEMYRGKLTHLKRDLRELITNLGLGGYLDAINNQRGVKARRI
ncbi:MAG: type II toxin-antitoxin system ParD family antitoxin [Methanomicrobium sp.]|nr:type II toxin-antitoxin system ParD family antitoxin [Methanomicrobium sp.]